MNMRFLRPTVCALVFALGVSVFAKEETRALTLRFGDSVRRYFGVPNEYLNHAGLSGVRVAILADGFGDLSEPKTGKIYLPPTFELMMWEEQGAKPPDTSSLTGLRAAIAICDIVGATDTNAPRMRLYNANSLTGFKLSMQDAIDWKADIILSFKNYESFSNFDGTGGINPLPENLVRNSNTFWIHSAGEYRGLVRHGALGGLEPKEYPGVSGKWIPTHTNGYPFMRFKANSSLKTVKASLSWSAFPNSQDFKGTNKDLDLVIFAGDENERPVRELARKSTRQSENPDPKKNETAVPREELTLEALAPSEEAYLVGIQYVGGTFDRGDRFHVVLQPSIKAPFTDDADTGSKTRTEKLPLEFVDASPKSTLLTPADNTQTFVVGDYSQYSSIGPVLANPQGKSASKPQLILDEVVLHFNDGGALAGPNSASTLFTAFAVMMKAVEPSLKPQHYRQYVRDLSSRFSVDSPYLDAAAMEKQLQRDGWLTTESEKETFFYSYTDFQRLGFAKLEGRGYAVKKDAADDHPKIGMMRIPPDLPAFKKLDAAQKTDFAKKKFYLYTSGKDQTAALHSWIGWASSLYPAGAREPKPWELLGGTAKDFFEIVDLSVPVMDYESDYQKSKRFEMPSIATVKKLAKD